MQELLNSIVNRSELPRKEDFLTLLERINQLFLSENKMIRPDSDSGEPGGIINLQPGIPTIIVPDLHGRREFLGELINQKTQTGTILDLLEKKALQVICVGDGFHKELDAKERWLAALKEYEKSYKKHKNIDQEMIENLSLMEIVIRLKLAFPENFHFLKGNHENIRNEETGGDHPFRKFALEGDMVKTWTLQFLGRDFLEQYSKFEKQLPLLAIGENFLISHAEPQRFFEDEEIRNYHSDAVHGLTWTANGESEEGSVEQMLNYYVPHKKMNEKLYFGGHRIIMEKYKLRSQGFYVQIHNPWKYQVAFIKPDKAIDLERDIIELTGSR